MIHPRYIVVCPVGRTWHFKSIGGVRRFLVCQRNPDEFAIYKKVDLPKAKKKERENDLA